MNAWPRIGLVLAAGLLFFSASAAPAESPARVLAAGPPTTVSSRYATTNVGQVLRVGNIVYVAGVDRVAPPTGSAVVISASNGTAEPVKARVAGGSVRTAISDNSGGWYIGGTFTSVGGVARSGLAHLSSDGTLDTAFAPPALGQVRALVLDAGRLYVGGLRALPPTADSWLVPVLSALDPVTGVALPISYTPLATAESRGAGVVALAAGGGRLYAAFNATNGIAAYDEASGGLLWSQPGTPSETYSGPAALALAGGRLLVGGQISTPSGPVALEELDPTTGIVVGQLVDQRVSGIATVAATAYILIDGGNGGGIWKLDVPHGTWTRLAVSKFGSAIATDGKTLYVARWDPAAGGVRIDSLNLGHAEAGLRPLSRVTVGGNPNALALQNGRLLVGGSILGLGGIKRAGVAAFDARTGTLLPWRPAVKGGGVMALAHSGKTIYLGGQFNRVSGQRRHGLAAVSALGTGKLLPWHPRLSYADIQLIAVAGGRVFAGGFLKAHGVKASTPPSSLLAFSAKTGKQVAFKPRIQGITALIAWRRLLLAGTTSNEPARGARVRAFRLDGDGRTVWTRSISGGNVPIVFALQTTGSTLYVGGRFTQVGGEPRANLAALALDRSGAILNFAPQIPDQVMALARTDFGLVFGMMPLSGAPWLGRQALGAVSLDGHVKPWQITLPPSDVVLSDRDSGGTLNVSIEHLTVVPDGLEASGGSSWIGPPNRPALGNLVWLR